VEHKRDLKTWNPLDCQLIDEQQCIPVKFWNTRVDSRRRGDPQQCVGVLLFGRNCHWTARTKRNTRYSVT